MNEQPVIEPETWAGFQTRLRAYVSRRVEPAVVDDVTGDVLLRLLRRQEDLIAAQNPLAWMFRVASNVIADHHRRRAAEARAKANAGKDSGLERDPASPDDNLAAEFAQCVGPFIRALPPRYSEAILLTDMEGLTQREAAKRLGLSLSGMKSRVQRGRAKLKQALLRCCDIQTDRYGTVLDYHSRAFGRKSKCRGDDVG